MLALEKSENNSGPWVYECSSFLHYLLPVTRLRERRLAVLHRTIPRPLQGPAALKEINHYHHNRDDQENVKDSAHGVRGD